MRERMLWGGIIGFLAGVLLRSLVAISYPAALFALLLSLVIACFAYVDAPKRRALPVVVFFLAISLGIVRMDLATYTADPHLSAFAGRTMMLTGTISAEPDVRDTSTRLTVGVQSVGNGIATSTASGRVLVVAPAHADVAYGHEIIATGRLKRPESFDTAAGRSFNYPMYLAKDGILYELSFAKVVSTGSNVGNPITIFALGIKHALLSGLRAALPEPEAGLAAGITLGDKRSVGTDLAQSFTRVSLIHMVVLSGYNITVVINAASWLALYFPRIVRFGIAGSVVTFFILMTGGAATSVRAGIMALIAVYARMSGRLFFPLRILGVVCAGMVAWNPYTLAFDPSFQLSALATAGLVVFTPHVTRWCARIPEGFGLREIVASTIATQATVLPLLLYQSGNLSLVALPANLLTLPAVPAAMALSAIVALVGTVTPTIAAVLALPAYALLRYIIMAAQLFASIPFASVTIPAFSGAWLALIYGALIAGAVRLERSERVERKQAA